MNSSIEKNSSNDPKDAMRMSKTNPLSNSIEVATNVIPKPSEADEYYDEEVDSDSELEMDEQQKAFMEFLEQKAAEDSNFQIDFEEVLYTLNYDLPMIPGVPMV